ncbi:phosphatidate cytidylyltransferase [Auritidibacter ignavus]|uniref:phosphatidate cytidylyltransferase n=1 Tax=Auritidibacter ignavus TaxID=678932 RepID=UPI00109C5FFC|nr:phosphatidate cytidylyltransferase [Auritidibacter ignavus]
MSQQDPTGNTGSSPGEDPVITELEGFDNLVRDPETGRIIPQTRKERKALEAAQAEIEHQRALPETVGAERGESDDTDPETAEPAMELGPDHSEVAKSTETTNAEPATGVDNDPVVAPTTVSERPAKLEEPKQSKAGRNLPAAIAVGAVLLVAAIIGIFWVPVVVMVLISLLLLVGTWEMSRLYRPYKIEVPLVPLWVGALAMPISAYFGGIDAMVFALFGMMILAVFWTVISDPYRPLAAAMTTGFIVLWVPFMLSFGVVLMQEPEGNYMVALFLLAVVANDTFGYIVGALFGKHPMAPQISPKKSWEGFAGSLVGAVLVSIGAGWFMLDLEVWRSVIVGLVMVVVATTGDFAASMVKRDLGVKDMGNTLPGHGGVMDRLDSLVFGAPVAFALFVVLFP